MLVGWRGRGRGDRRSDPARSRDGDGDGAKDPKKIRHEKQLRWPSSTTDQPPSLWQTRRERRCFAAMADGANARATTRTRSTLEVAQLVPLTGDHLGKSLPSTTTIERFIRHRNMDRSMASFSAIIPDSSSTGEMSGIVVESVALPREAVPVRRPSGHTGGNGARQPSHTEI